ncbi:hypothetical protein PIB30_056665 [Stylosanthes scabra]|uniref:Uncharacterized protein n=1 Tax=Stylosanthes scabra TaxID=79078 RepID=A0ABU6WMS4_9FABA|nr:hypothetical protein [Stylosanthes scabra]
MEEGIGPLSRQKERSRLCKLLSVHNSLGIEPSKRFEDMFKVGERREGESLECTCELKTVKINGGYRIGGVTLNSSPCVGAWSGGVVPR